MAKKRKGNKPKATAAKPATPSSLSPPPVVVAKPARVPALVPLPAQQPAFWFGFDVAWAKLVVVRVVLFGLLAIDAILQIRHAPRYSAGGFNVAQIPGFDALGPSRATYEIAQLVSAYLFVLAALGVATRSVLPVVTSLYAWMYFTSQLDGYQHHYLVALVLGISCFVPWQRRAETEPATAVRTWAVRLILVQLAILYLWAAISKMNAAWLDGRTLANQITGPLRELVDSSVGIRAAAKFAIFAEITLALTVWIRPAWFIALPLGLLFHTGILLSGLEIGLFAWLMLGLYLLVVPDRAFVWAAEQPAIVAVRTVVKRIRLESDVATGIAVVGGAAAAVAVAMLCRLDHALVVAVALALVPIIIVGALRVRGKRGGAFIGIAHLAAILVWVAVDRASDV
ncbi:MAG: HTTM domain-containing protein, partial [Polyangiales bacterium]